MMEHIVKDQGDQVIFTISGSVGERGAEALKKSFKQLNLSVISELILDFSAVDHIGSAGMGKLLLFYKNLASCGGKLRVVNANSSIREIFSELNLDTLFCVD